MERGPIASADREHLAGWLSRFDGRAPVAFAMEGCTGWRYVAEEMRQAGVEVAVGDPVIAWKKRIHRLVGDSINPLVGPGAAEALVCCVGLAADYLEF